MQRFDVIVAGLGAMGSATAYHLARRGARVLGLDRFAPPHDRGSSHGGSRIIREAYLEHPLYVPLVRRAYELWAELERESGRHLFLRTGGLMIGPPDGYVAAGARRSAVEHALPFEELSAEELHRRFPGYRPPPGDVGIFEPRAGLLVPEACVEAHLEGARRAGAELRAGEPALAWSASGDAVEVTTPRGACTADRLVLTLGAWTGSLLPELRLPLAVERVVVHWFRPERAPELYAPDRFPIFIAETAPGRAWYGFPDTGHGVKVGLHHQGEPAVPDTLRRDVAQEEVERVRELLRRFMPGADGPLLRSSVCMYTNTPDEHFVIGFHPATEHVLVSSPCSGHGFKFSSAIGELQAELLAGGRPRFDLAPFRLDRFGISPRATSG
ncbi:MAG TPA: N-methyl-L-tryptophan oxidase [Longimicrobiales bacterium]|nr:N-methyl-L-tryptophan oxidase [Longimicrobiales bacterium]